MRNQHNYQTKINRLLQAGQLTPQPGQVIKVHVYHDNYCQVFKGGLCNCNPDIKADPIGRQLSQTSI